MTVTKIKIKARVIILSLIGLGTAILNGYYLWGIKPQVNTPEDGLVYTGSFILFIISALLVFGSYNLFNFLESTDERKYKKVFFQSIFFAMGFVVFSMVGLIFLIVVVYSTFPEWSFIFWDIFFNKKQYEKHL